MISAPLEARCADEARSPGRARRASWFKTGQAVAPLKDRLARVKTVIISPDGPLNALPFDALLKENGEGLLHLYPI
jgi:hypothetical protein